MLNIILFLAFGLIIGALARLIVPGTERGGWLTSLLIGVVGSYLGGFVARWVGLSEGAYSGFGGWVAAIIGAIVVAFGYHALMARRARTRTPR